MIVEKYMTKTLHKVASDATIEEAIGMMRSLSVRHLPVMRSGELVGLLSERDLYWAQGIGNLKNRVIVEDAMTPYPYVVGPDAPLREVAMTMAAGKYGSAIIAEGGKVLGVFTTTDAMRALADALQTG